MKKRTRRTHSPGVRAKIALANIEAPEMPMFMPVLMLGAGGTKPDLSRPEPQPAPSSPSVRPHPGLIEIDLGNGSQVRVGSDVNFAALRRALVALRG